MRTANSTLQNSPAFRRPDKPFHTSCCSFRTTFLALCSSRARSHPERADWIDRLRHAPCIRAAYSVLTFQSETAAPRVEKTADNVLRPSPELRNPALLQPSSPSESREKCRSGMVTP